MTDDSHRPHSADDPSGAVVDDLEAAGYGGDEFEDEDLEEEDFEEEGDFDEDEDYLEDQEDDPDGDDGWVMSSADLPSSGLLSFYDRLRGAVLATVDRRGGKLGAGAVRALLLAPDLFMLLARLVLDRTVPSSSRALVGGALAYFLLPMDLLPEALLGVGGYVDDVVLAAAVLSQVFSEELEPYVRRHWSGPEDLRVVLRDIAGAGSSLLGENLYSRLKALLAKRGVDVEAEEERLGELTGPELDDDAGRAGA
jgi:uncharacterized membrane protein YkvA (DUF1232 family)